MCTVVNIPQSTADSYQGLYFPCVLRCLHVSPSDEMDQQKLKVETVNSVVNNETFNCSTETCPGPNSEHKLVLVPVQHWNWSQVNSGS